MFRRLQLYRLSNDDANIEIRLAKRIRMLWSTVTDNGVVRDNKIIANLLDSSYISNRFV
jgi:hypothetical protein